jgi:curved DNA-binding protein
MEGMAVKFRDYYEILGVPRSASTQEIKRAYRQLARKHHPDLQPPAQRAQATERFKEINEAHEVLADPKKRAQYDALGENWKSGMDFTPPPGAGPGGGSADFGDWEDLEGFSDFFASIFGGARARRGGGGAAGRRGSRARGGVRFTIPPADIEAELPVTLAELLRGGHRRITLPDGRGLDVTIPAGVRDGTVLRLARQGEPSGNGESSGDLYLHIRVIPDARFRVAGDDIEMDLRLWPWQAVLGAEVRVDTPDGAVKLKIPPGTQNGRRLRLAGRGLPRGRSSRGDLFAVIRIVVPEHPSAAEREAYEALKRSAATSPDRPAHDGR